MHSLRKLFQYELCMISEIKFLLYFHSVIHISMALLFNKFINQIIDISLSIIYLELYFFLKKSSIDESSTTRHLLLKETRLILNFSSCKFILYVKSRKFSKS